MKYREQTSTKWIDRDPSIYFGIDSFDIPANKVNFDKDIIADGDRIFPKEDKTYEDSEVTLHYKEEENSFVMVAFNKDCYLTESDLKQPFLNARVEIKKLQEDVKEKPRQVQAKVDVSIFERLLDILKVVDNETDYSKTNTITFYKDEKE